jgi:FMN-dependent NADH-azoreductase
MSLLHLDASANRSGGSVSRQLTALFAGTWRARHDTGGYRYRDLAADPVPPLDSAFCALGRRVERHGTVPRAGVTALAETPAERLAWSLTRPLIEEPVAADTLLIGAPLYTYAVPAALKAWIDRVSFPGAFTDPDTGDSLLCATRVVVVSARGGAYGPGAPREGWDFQTPYLRAYFTNHGVPEENLSFVSAELTLADLLPHRAPFRPAAARSLARARADVTALATTAVCGTVRSGVQAAERTSG